MDGGWSGIQGATTAPGKDAYLAWARTINDAGGINGHRVDVIVTDSGDDPNRQLANVRYLVEQKRVLAVVNAFTVTKAVVDYLTAKRIPLIGGQGLEEQWHTSPWLFAPTTSPDNGDWALAKMGVDEGGKKFAIVWCQEAPICKERADVVAKFVRELGGEVVYEASVSIAQPNFTAVCLNARNAGAESFVPYTDGNSINRMANDCSQQGYHPQWLTAGPGPNVVPGLEGMIGAFRWFPWFHHGHPEIDRFHAAMRKYAPDRTLFYFSAMGWTNGVLLEKAAQHISASQRPTTAALLEGLWTMKREALGGIAIPFTFVKGKPAPHVSCVLQGQVVNERWTLPHGLKLVACRPGGQ